MAAIGRETYLELQSESGKPAPLPLKWWLSRIDDEILICLPTGAPFIATPLGVCPAMILGSSSWYGHPQSQIVLGEKVLLQSVKDLHWMPVSQVKPGTLLRGKRGDFSVKRATKTRIALWDCNVDMASYLYLGAEE